MATARDRTDRRRGILALAVSGLLAAAVVTITAEVPANGAVDRAPAVVDQHSR